MLEGQDQQEMRIEIVAADGDRIAARQPEFADRADEFPEIADRLIKADLALAIDEEEIPGPFDGMVEQVANVHGRKLSGGGRPMSHRAVIPVEEKRSLAALHYGTLTFMPYNTII